MRNYIGRANWADNSHDWAKAYVCSLFSILAYAVIPPVELERVGRISIVPCELYQRLLLEKRSFTAQDIRGALEFEAAFEVIGRMLLILAVKTGNIIFVSVRGSSVPYDYYTDGKFALRKGHDAKWHTGFYGLALDHIKELSQKMREIRKEGDIVIVTGHSLGGAVAGILHAIWDEPVPDSGFVFGTPRYVAKVKPSEIRWPVQYFHSWDFFTYVPPRRIGYIDIPNPYQTNAGPSAGYSDSAAFLEWGARRLSRRQFPKSHFIENYRRDIGLHLGFDDEAAPWS
jgi:hypothetical protein